MAEGGVGHEEDFFYEEDDFSPEFREYMERELYDSSRVYVPFSRFEAGWVFWDRRDAYPDPTLECAEEQLGLPARVFLHKLPEVAPYLSYNTLDLASSCKMKTSWAVPVFEKDSPTCAGVLEIASFRPMHLSWYYGDFLDWKGDIFQEFGLSCFDEYKHRIMQCEDKNEAHIAAFKELEVACNSVYEIPCVGFAFAWVPSRSCSDVLRGLFKIPALHRESLMKSTGIFHMRKVHIIGSEVPISSLLCCWDIGKCNIYQSLLGYVSCTGCFTMCLRSSYTAELYVVQFFLSTDFFNHKNNLSKLRLIMDTMKGYSGTFRLAYGQEWGEELPLVVIDSLKDQKNHHIEKIPPTRCPPDLEFLNDGPVTLQLLSLLDRASVTLQLGYQPSIDSITNGSEAQNSNSPNLASLPNGIEVMRVDSSDQKSHSIETIPATGYIPRRWRPPSVDSVNNGMYACTEALNSYTLSDPSHDSLPNGVEMMQVDSSDQASVDPSNSFKDREQSMELNSDDRVSAVGAFRNPAIQDANTVTVKAKLEKYSIKFSLSLTPRLIEFHEEVAKRNIDPGAYVIICTDGEGEMPIGCDYDLQQWIEKSTLLGNTSITVTLRPKQPTPT